MSAETRAQVTAALQLAGDAGGADPRADVQAALLASMQRLIKGVTEFPAIASRGRYEGCFAAYVHVQGRPRWGPVRRDIAAAKADRRTLLESKRADRLDAALAALHAAAQGL